MQRMIKKSALAMAAADHAAFSAKLRAFPDAYRAKDDMPSMADIAKTMDDLGRTFEAFKEKNDQRLAQIEETGASDVVTTDEFEKMKSDVLKLRDDQNKLAKHAARPGATSAGDLITPEQKEHREAFITMLRNPEDEQAKSALQQIQRKAVQGTTDAAGGYAIPEIIAQQVQRDILEITDVLQVVNVVRAGSKDYKELVDRLGLAYAWVGETDTRNESGTPTLAETAPTFGTLYSYPRATEESMMDIFFDVEAWLRTSIVEGHSRGIENAIINGDGSNKPTGMLDGTPVATEDGSRAFGVLQYVPGGAAAALNDGDALINTVQTLKAGYRANARWMMNRATVGTIMTLKDGDGNYLWKMGDIQSGQPDRLLGYSVTESEEMPDVAADAFPLAFGDFRAGYTAVILAGMRMTRDEITTPGYVKWYARQRLGGSLRKDEAIKLLKIATS